MTRKHFNALAQFAGSNNLDDDLIVELADVCKSFNRRWIIIKYSRYRSRRKACW